MRSTVLLVFLSFVFFLFPKGIFAAETVVVIPLFKQAPVVTGELFNYSRNINQTQGRLTAYTVPAGKTLIITDITVDTMTGFETENSRFYLEGPGYDVKTAITIIYPDSIHHSYTSGIAFESGEDVIVWVNILPYDSHPFRQFDITLTGIIVQN